MTRFKLIPEAHIVLLKEDQIFLLQRANTGYADGQYALIAGHIDGGEPAHLAACREAKEEAGIIINPDDLTPRAALDLIYQLKRLRLDGSG